MRALPRQLGDGLVLRRAALADTEALAAFNQRIHGDEGDEVGVAAWTRDLMEKPHPTFRPDDFTIVEHEESGAIVSSLNLIPQTWRYRGVPFDVGRIELVGTDPEYRRRGLVRAQMDEVHRWCAERGMMAQGITGIPNYYRRFGYEMTIALGAGRSGPLGAVPKLPDGQEEPYFLRKATAEDAPFLAGVHAWAADRYVVSDVWSEEFWRYAIEGRAEESMIRYPVEVITTPDGERVGVLAPMGELGFKGAAVVLLYELAEGVPWTLVTPVMLRHMLAFGKAAAGDKTLSHIYLALGTEHPAYDVLARFLHPPRSSYAWYVRVPDVVGFLRHVSPALEWQLAESSAAGHTGELKISFYESGVRMTFEQGLISGIEPFAPADAEDGDAQFPDLTFLHLLFGHRSLAELETAFADCHAGTDTAAALLDGMFPPGPSHVGGIE